MSMRIIRAHVVLVPALVTCWAVPSSIAGDLVVTAEFEGGSARIEAVDQEARRIKLLPAEHRDRGWVCWWYVRVDGIEPGETLVLDVGGGVWATPDRATFSTDGRTWRHTEPGRRTKDRIEYRVTVDAKAAWFAWGPPFTPSDAERLCREIAEAHSFVERFELCRTRGDRVTPALRIQQGEEEDRFGIWIQARQHAWESGSSWVGRGFVEWLVSDDPDSEWLRRHARVTFVPIMDVDNTAIGAGGKNQVPQDHNRDWTDEPHWRAVAAAQKEIVLADADGRFDLFVDLHNPGANDREPYYYVSPREELPAIGRRNVDRFVAASKAEMTGPLGFKGRTVESGANYDPQWRAISKNWVTTHTRDHVVAVTLETSWNTPHSTTVGYRRIGRELGRATARYLRTNPREPETDPKSR